MNPDPVSYPFRQWGRRRRRRWLWRRGGCRRRWPTARMVSVRLLNAYSKCYRSCRSKFDSATDEILLKINEWEDGLEFVSGTLWERVSSVCLVDGRLEDRVGHQPVHQAQRWGGRHCSSKWTKSLFQLQCLQCWVDIEMRDIPSSPHPPNKQNVSYGAKSVLLKAL